MNKIITTLAGLALVAGASAVPAFAQGSFTNSAPFSFSGPSGGTFSVTAVPVTYNPLGGSVQNGFLTLTGSSQVDSSPVFSNTKLTFTNGGFSITDTIPLATVIAVPSGGFSISSVGASPAGDSFNLASSPVPEASTVLSFGALLALGGLAVLRRKSVKNAA